MDAANTVLGLQSKMERAGTRSFLASYLDQPAYLESLPSLVPKLIRMMEGRE